MKRLGITLLFLASAKLFAQNLAPLSVEKIMRNPQWIGVAPSNVAWSLSSNKVYFNWNPDKKTTDPIFSIGLIATTPQVVSDAEEQSLNRRNVVFNKKNTQALFDSMKQLYMLPKDERLRMGDISRVNIVSKFEQKFVWEAILNEYKALEISD